MGARAVEVEAGAAKAGRMVVARVWVREAEMTVGSTAAGMAAARAVEAVVVAVGRGASAAAAR